MFGFRNKLERILPRFVRLYTQIGIDQLKENAKSLILEPLSQRELIRVRGDEADEFLQGLTTNDIRNISYESNDSKAMYSMFLNKSGRVLYDAIIFKVPEKNTFLIECDKNISSELRRLLRVYRVRRKVDIDAVYKDYRPWVVFDATQTNESIPIKQNASICALTDPRLKTLGVRIITQSEVEWNDLASHLRNSFLVKVNHPTNECNYEHQRYNDGIPEGVEDIPPGKFFPFETNGDLLNGLSFDKGCYIGQELTARVHHTGVIRKRFMPMQLTAPLAANMQIQTTAGAKVGQIVSYKGNKALGLIRLEKALQGIDLEVDGEPVFLKTPNWWPSHIVENRAVRQ